MGRSPCCSKEGLNRGAWTKREDMILSEYIRIHGDGGWRNISKRAGLKRCGKSCRLRWLNYLRPDIKRGNISPDEEELIIRLHRLLGNRWSLIAGRLPGRTDNEIKNYWNTHMSKKLLPMKESQLKILSSKPPSRLPNQVFKANPVKITTVVSPSGIGRPKCYRNHRSDETMNSSKSRYQALVNDSITGTESNPITSAKVDNLVATEAAMSSLADQQSLESNHFGAATMAESLLYLNELSSPDSDLLCYPSNYSTDFVFYSVPTTQTNEFYSVPTTQTNEFYSVPTTQTNEFEGICSDQSNMEGVDNFTVAEKQGMEELFHNEQRLDWIHDIDYLKKSSSQPLSLLLEAEDEWEERVRGKTVLENGEQIP